MLKEINFYLQDVFGYSATVRERKHSANEKKCIQVKKEHRKTQIIS